MKFLNPKTQPRYFLTGILTLLFLFSACSKDPQKADSSPAALNNPQPRPASLTFHFLKGTWFFESEDAESVTCINGNLNAPDPSLKKTLWESLLKVFGFSQELQVVQEKDRLRFDFVEGNRVKAFVVKSDGNKQEQVNRPLTYVADKKAFQSLQSPSWQIEFEDADPSYRILILPEDTGICRAGGKIRLKLKMDDQHHLAVKIEEFKQLKAAYFEARAKESLEAVALKQKTESIETLKNNLSTLQTKGVAGILDTDCDEKLREKRRKAAEKVQALNQDIEKKEKHIQNQKSQNQNKLVEEDTKVVAAQKTYSEHQQLLADLKNYIMIDDVLPLSLSSLPKLKAAKQKYDDQKATPQNTGDAGWGAYLWSYISTSPSEQAKKTLQDVIKNQLDIENGKTLGLQQALQQAKQDVINRLNQEEKELQTLQRTTLPEAQSELSSAEKALERDKQRFLDERIRAAEASVTQAESELPGLQRDYDAIYTDRATFFQSDFTKQAVQGPSDSYSDKDSAKTEMQKVRDCYAQIVALINAICPGRSPQPTFDVDACAYPDSVPRPDPL